MTFYIGCKCSSCNGMRNICGSGDGRSINGGVSLADQVLSKVHVEVISRAGAQRLLLSNAQCRMLLVPRGGASEFFSICIDCGRGRENQVNSWFYLSCPEWKIPKIAPRARHVWYLERRQEESGRSRAKENVTL